MKIRDKTIFLVVQSGYGARYLLQSDVLKTLKSTGARIVILSPNGDEEHFRRELEDQNVFIEKIELDRTESYLRGSKLQRFLMLVRSFTLSTNQAPITSIEQRYKVFKDNFDNTWKSKLFSITLDLAIHMLRRSKFLRKSLIWLESRLFIGHFHRLLFEKYQPDMVVNTGLGYWYPDVFLMREGRFHKTIVTSVILSWDNTSTKGMAGAKPDYVITWTDVMKKELIEHHDIDPDSIYVGGVAHFDLYYKQKALLSKEELCEKFGLDPAARLLFLATKSPKSFPWNTDIAKITAEAIANNEFDFPCQLIVRLHPVHFLYKNGQSQFKKMLQEYDSLRSRYPFVFLSKPNMRSQHLAVDMPWDDMIELGSILKNADVLINMFSTVAIEASIFDLPIIHVGFEGDPSRRTKPRQSIKLDENEIHNQRVVHTGGVRIARNKEELAKLINRYVHNRSLEAEQRRVIKKQECGPFPGKAGRIIGEHLIRMLQ